MRPRGVTKEISSMRRLSIVSGQALPAPLHRPDLKDLRLRGRCVHAEQSILGAGPGFRSRAAQSPYPAPSPSSRSARSGGSPANRFWSCHEDGLGKTIDRQVHGCFSTCRPNEVAPRHRFTLAELRGRLTCFHGPLAGTDILLQNMFKIRNPGAKRHRYQFDLDREDEAAIGVAERRNWSGPLEFRQI